MMTVDRFSMLGEGPGEAQMNRIFREIRQTYEAHKKDAK
jgi:hypothetical protein